MEYKATHFETAKLHAIYFSGFKGNENFVMKNEDNLQSVVPGK